MSYGKFIKTPVLFFIMMFVLISGIFGQSNTKVRQLKELLDNKEITINAQGNGSSSGTSILGTIMNVTPNEFHVNVIINNGIYFENSGEGQNMIATQIYLSDMSYFGDDKDFFIILRPNALTPVAFIAYCANFERSNPSAAEKFTAAPTPPNVRDISAKISRYMADNFDTDEIIAIQLALWRTQGKSRSEISKVFEFNDSDWNLSTTIMNY